MEKISVIIPVYNGEKYLEQSVRSVCQQSYSNLEILIINDGSSDQSGLKAEQLKLEDSRIKVLHKKINEGLGAARNSALDLATGDYILFLDADDWIDPNHVDDLYDLLRRTDSDVAVANFSRYFEEENRFELHLTDADYYEKVYSPQEGSSSSMVSLIILACVLLYLGVSFISAAFFIISFIIRVHLARMIEQLGSFT